MPTLQIGDVVYRKKEYKKDELGPGVAYAGGTREAEVLKSVQGPQNKAGYFEFKYLDGLSENETLRFNAFLKEKRRGQASPTSPVSPTSPAASNGIRNPRSGILRSPLQSIQRGLSRVRENTRRRGARRVQYADDNEESEGGLDSPFDSDGASDDRMSGDGTPVDSPDLMPVRRSNPSTTPHRNRPLTFGSDSEMSEDNEYTDEEEEDDDDSSYGHYADLVPDAYDDVEPDEDDFVEDFPERVYDDEGVDEEATAYTPELEECNTKGRRKKKEKLSYKEAQKKYEREKKKLLEEEVPIVVKVGKKGLQNGSSVLTRKKPHRMGTIDGDRVKIEGKWKWPVVFDDDDGDSGPQYFSSQSLTNISDVTEYVWNIVSDHVPEDNTRRSLFTLNRKKNSDYKDIGVQGFDFNRFKNNEVSPEVKDEDWDFPYLSLLIHMWPGQWREQLDQLNDALEKKGYRIMSPSEFFAHIGVYLSAAKQGVGGEKLFERKEKVGKGGKKAQTRQRTTKDPIDITSKINGGAKGQVTQNRFNNVKSVFQQAFYDQEAKAAGDPWWKVMKLVDGYNENRQKTVLASKTKVLDESMCAFQPRTTQFGGLPNISFIPRKPRPIGAEWKVIACSVTGLFLYLEVQRGQNPMRKMPYCNQYGALAACVRRAIDVTAYQGSELQGSEQAAAKKDEEEENFLGDSWFTNKNTFDAAAEAGHRYFGILKKPHGKSGFPLDEVAEIMKDWPSGSYLVYECTTPAGNEIFYVGYKYSGSRDVIHGAGNAGIGSTEKGKDYLARYADDNGNLKNRKVFRPQIFSTFFGASNQIDSHNHVRQGVLALEELWRTTDCWLKLFQSYLGMTCTDGWKAVRFALRNSKENVHHKMGIVSFADRIAWDCFNAPASFFDTAVNIAVSASSAVPSQAPNANNPRVDPNNARLPYGWTSLNDKQLFVRTRALHKIKKTDKKDSAQRASRRACARNGCKGRVSTACSNDVCMAEEANSNRYTTFGIPICGNDNKCIDAHVHKIIKTYCNKDVSHINYESILADAVADGL